MQLHFRCDVLSVFDQIEGQTGIHRSKANSLSSELLNQNWSNIVNKSHNMLHKLSLDDQGDQ